MNYIPKSQAILGKRLTYKSVNGSVGLGYLVNGDIYRSCGNGYYQKINVVSFTLDNGEGYLKLAERFTGYRSR